MFNIILLWDRVGRGQRVCVGDTTAISLSVITGLSRSVPKSAKWLERLKRKAQVSIGTQGPVVRSIVSLTTSLRCQLVKYMLTTLSNALLFFVGKM